MSFCFYLSCPLFFVFCLLFLNAFFVFCFLIFDFDFFVLLSVCCLSSIFSVFFVFSVFLLLVLYCLVFLVCFFLVFLASAVSAFESCCLSNASAFVFAGSAMQRLCLPGLFSPGVGEA